MYRIVYKKWWSNHSPKNKQKMMINLFSFSFIFACGRWFGEKCIGIVFRKLSSLLLNKRPKNDLYRATGGTVRRKVKHFFFLFSSSFTRSILQANKQIWKVMRREEMMDFRFLFVRNHPSKGAQNMTSETIFSYLITNFLLPYLLI